MDKYFFTWREILTNPKYEIFKDTQDQFRFRLIGPDGDVVVKSHSFGSKRACKECISAIREFSAAPILDLTFF